MEDDGIVVVNDALVEVSVDDGPEVFVNGTYLVTFKRTAFINGTKYVNINDYPKRLPQLATSARLNATYHHALLSLPFLHKLSEKNLQRISELRIRTIATAVATAVICAIISVTTIGLIIY